MTIAAADFTLTILPASPAGGGGGGSASPILIVPANPLDPQGTVAQGSLPNGTEGQPLSEPVCTVSGGVQPYSYVFSGQPEDLTFEETTNADGSVTITTAGTPAVGDAGDYDIALTVTDSSTPPATASIKRRI